MFEAIGLPTDVIEERFGFLVGALKYGTPPHGGLAFRFRQNGDADDWH